MWQLIVIYSTRFVRWTFPTKKSRQGSFRYYNLLLVRYSSTGIDSLAPGKSGSKFTHILKYKLIYKSYFQNFGDYFCAFWIFRNFPGFFLHVLRHQFETWYIHLVGVSHVKFEFRSNRDTLTYFTAKNKSKSFFCIHGLKKYIDASDLVHTLI